MLVERIIKVNGIKINVDYAKEYTSLPKHYPVCEHRSCPMAATYLHQTAYSTLMEQEEYLRLIIPSRCSKNESCIYYRYNKPVTYARGFTNFQKRMFPDQYSRFMSICINHWSRNTYIKGLNIDNYGHSKIYR